MQAALAHFKELLALRKDSLLLRLPTAEDIQKRLDFLPGTESMPGLIAMRMSDEVCGLSDLDPRYREMLVIFNMRPETAVIPYSKELELHAIQARGRDPLVKQTVANGSQISVPGRTTAVLISRQTTAQLTQAGKGALEIMPRAVKKMGSCP